MIRYTLLLPIVVTALLLASPAERAIAQKKTPVPSTQEQSRLIDQGTAMHDNQDFEGAIEKYRQVLAENPDNVDALYELSYAQLEKGDYGAAIESAERGIVYKSELLPLFYITLGTGYDALKETRKAIDAYVRGIRDAPEHYLLHYNLAVTYANTKRYQEAGESFRRAVVLKPDHPSSHFGLGNIYLIAGNRVPAICALSRFLVLEPLSTRSDAALAALETLIDPDLDSIVVVKRKKGKDGGDFPLTEAVLAIPDSSSGEMEGTVERFRAIFSALAGEQNQGFAGGYYAPYFAEIVRRKFVEPFCYYTFQSTGNSDVRKWLKSNDASVKSFLTWSGGYQWKGSTR
ncbi:MAG: tetratricopeptide repeat protein [Chlorobi bacterium]|nr:tetratricopeptide repeat protein [Chlorobiota bacterium]